MKVTIHIIGFPSASSLSPSTVSLPFEANGETFSDAAEDVFSLFNDPTREEELARTFPSSASKLRSFSVGDVVERVDERGLSEYLACISYGWSPISEENFRSLKEMANPLSARRFLAAL